MKKIKLPDIHVPIDSSNLLSVLPSGEDIIYSTQCIVKETTTPRKFKWTAHVIITQSGVGATKTIMFADKKKPPTVFFMPWQFTGGVLSLGPFGTSISLLGIAYKLQKFKQESKFEFKQRIKEFIARFRPLYIQRTSEWLEQNKNNPDPNITPRQLMVIEGGLRFAKSREQKRIDKEKKKPN